MADSPPGRCPRGRSVEEDEDEKEEEDVQDALKKEDEEEVEDAQDELKKEDEEEPPCSCQPDEEYELERARYAYYCFQRIQPWWCEGSIVYAVVMAAAGRQSHAAGLGHSLLPLGMLSILRLMSGPFKVVVERDLRWYGIAVQTGYFVGNLMVRTVVGVQSEPGLLQHRVYLATVFTLMISVACLGYVPDRVFHFVLCPSMIASWMYFHAKVEFFHADSVCMCFVVLSVTAFIRSQSISWSRQSFMMARELREARQTLEQVMSAQQGMLSSFFDASCACDERGQVTRLTPQMTQMLGSCDGALVGREVSDLAAESEQKRLREFMEKAWASGTGKTSMIQVSFGREGQPGARGGSVEARLYCVRLPDVSKVADLEAGLWTHGGMFVGLQEVSDCSNVGAVVGGEGAPGVEAAAKPLWQGSLPVEHSIDFDAGSPDLDVIGCSTLFGCSGLVPEESKLVDLFQKDVATQIDEWVYSEVQAAPVGRASRSKKFVRSLNFQLPPSPGMPLVARKVWLEFGGKNGQEAEIPVTLKMSGLRVSGGAQGAADTAGWRAQLDPIEEQSDGSDGACSSDGEGSEAGASTLMPDDSASQAHCQRSLLFRPREQKEEDP